MMLHNWLSAWHKVYSFNRCFAAFLALVARCVGHSVDTVALRLLHVELIVFQEGSVLSPTRLEAH